MNQICMFQEIPSDVYGQNGLRNTFLHNMEGGGELPLAKGNRFSKSATPSHVNLSLAGV